MGGKMKSPEPGTIISWEQLIDWEVERVDKIQKENKKQNDRDTMDYPACPLFKLQTKEELKKDSYKDLRAACEHFQVPISAIWEYTETEPPDEVFEARFQWEMAKQAKPFFVEYQGKRYVYVGPKYEGFIYECGLMLVDPAHLGFSES